MRSSSSNIQIIDTILERFDDQSSVLDLSNLNFTDQAVDAIAAVLQNNPHITELNLSGNNISPENFERLIKLCPEKNFFSYSLLSQEEITYNAIAPRLIQANPVAATHLARTCKSFRTLFQPNLRQYLCNEAKPFVAGALKHAAFGEKEELDELLKKHPGLLYIRGVTQDPCGRTVHGTIYRIALGAKDWSPFPEKNVEEMAEMIERHMKKLSGGEEEIELQKAEQFPEGWDAQEKIREEKDSAALKEVFAAIDQSKTDDDCKDAIEKFITYLKSQNEVKTGYHFNDKLLAEAQDLYVKNFEKFGGLNSRKNSLAAIKIIGSIQGRMTACLAMAHCDGLGRMIKEKQQLSRRPNLNDGSPFFSPGLGSSHFVISWRAEAVAAQSRQAGTAVVQVYKMYVEQKNQSHQKEIFPALNLTMAK